MLKNICKTFQTLDGAAMNMNVWSLQVELWSSFVSGVIKIPQESPKWEQWGPSGIKCCIQLFYSCWWQDRRKGENKRDRNLWSLLLLLLSPDKRKVSTSSLCHSTPTSDGGFLPLWSPLIRWNHYFSPPTNQPQRKKRKRKKHHSEPLFMAWQP